MAGWTMQPRRYSPAGRAGTAYVIDETPVMIGVPEKRDAPASVAIVTLCGTDASALENAIPNDAPAGAPSDAGAKRKSLASRATMTGAGVGRGDGVGVGRGVGLGLGVGAGVGFGVGVGVGLGAAVTVGAAVGLRTTVAVAEGARVGLGSAAGAGEGVPMVAADADGAADVDAVDSVAIWLDPAVASVVRPGDCGAAAPQAATSRLMAISRDNRGTGTAAL